jgi:steroid 5-alpha reductase family enzyme
MSIPSLNSLIECSNFQKTVVPYIPQLYTLPGQLFESWNNPAELQSIYLATNPLITAFAFSLFLAPVFLLISEVNKNYSQVDRIWSILPTIYNAHYVIFAHMSGLPTQRLDNLIAFSTVWSVYYIYDTWRIIF